MAGEENDVAGERAGVRFVDSSFSAEHRFSLGLDTGSGRHYVAIPVSNGLVDYEEYYGIGAEAFAVFSADPAAAVGFVEECRRHEHDDLLLQAPGSNRGTPV